MNSAATLSRKKTTNLEELSPRYMGVVKSIEKMRKDINAPIKLPAEVSLATQHNVARDTIRRAFDILEKDGAITRTRKRGTLLFPERIYQKSQDCRVIGLLLPWWADSIQAFYTSTILSGVHLWADKHDCDLRIYHVPRTDYSIEEYIQKINSKAVRALIWINPVPEQLKLLKAISKNVPCVVIGREYENLPVHTIVPDYNEAVRLIDSNLVSRGHKSYVVIGRSVLDPYGRSWINALNLAHESRGAEFDYRNYIDVTSFDRDKLGEMLVDYYFNKQPTVKAIVFTSSSYLKGFLVSQRVRGMIPDRISVVGFDYGERQVDSYDFPGCVISYVSCDWRKIGFDAMNVVGLLSEDGQNRPYSVIREPVSWIEGTSISEYKN